MRRAVSIILGVVDMIVGFDGGLEGRRLRIFSGLKGNKPTPRHPAFTLITVNALFRASAYPSTYSSLRICEIPTIVSLSSSGDKNVLAVMYSIVCLMSFGILIVFQSSLSLLLLSPLRFSFAHRIFNIPPDSVLPLPFHIHIHSTVSS